MNKLAVLESTAVESSPSSCIGHKTQLVGLESTEISRMLARCVCIADLHIAPICPMHPPPQLSSLVVVTYGLHSSTAAPLFHVAAVFLRADETTCAQELSWRVWLLGEASLHDPWNVTRGCLHSTLCVHRSF